jgi:hypothetical protein
MPLNKSGLILENDLVSDLVNEKNSFKRLNDFIKHEIQYAKFVNNTNYTAGNAGRITWR